MSANVQSRWEGGNLIFSDEAGNDLLVLDAANNRVTIPAAGGLEVKAGATVSGLVAAEAATTTTPGAVELATSAEATTGTDTGRAITPKALADAAAAHVPAASATVQGKVELATGPETIAVTDQARAVTPYGLGAALAKLFVISFTGNNGAGACTASGVAVGDVIFGIAGLTDMGQADASFEGTVTVNDQIQQSSASNLSAKNYMALVYRPS